MKAVAALAALFLLAAGSHAAAGTVTASCTEGGRVVYQEEFAAEESARRRIRIAAMNPGAMCVFLDAGRGFRAVPGFRDGRMPASTGSDADALASALAVIAAGSPGERHPPEAVEAMERMAAAAAGSTDRLTLGLALGVYRGVPMADVMAHWKLMQEESAPLAKLTPTVQVMGDVTVLSVEGVPETMAAEACEAAERLGSGCLAAY